MELEGLTGVCEGEDEVPKSRRVDENRRDGSLRLEEYWQDINQKYEDETN